MGTRFNLKLALGALAFFGVAAVPVAKAAIVNGGFEGFPDFTGYSTIGNTSIQGGLSPGDWHLPTEGKQQAFISNSSSASPGSAPAALYDTPANKAALNTFFNFNLGSVAGVNV